MPVQSTPRIATFRTVQARCGPGALRKQGIELVERAAADQGDSPSTRCGDSM